MRRQLVALLVASGWLMFLSTTAAEDEPVSSVMEKDFKWFDGLDYPTFTDRQFVLVKPRWTRDGSFQGGEYGFLLSDDESTFRVLTLSLCQLTFEKQSKGTGWDYQENRYDNRDLSTVAAKHLQPLPRPTDWRSKLATALRSRSSNNGATLFVLARACHAQGHKKLAEDLFEYAAGTPSIYDGARPGLRGLRATVAKELGLMETGRVIAAMAQPDTSRKELLRQFRRLKERFPNSPYAARVEEAIATLVLMIREDDAHVVVHRVSLEEMEMQQRVAELIFRLRDQTRPSTARLSASFNADNPLGDLLYARNDQQESPALQLVAIGKPALGQLIDSVYDQRFTRMVETSPHARPHIGRVVRVGECCFAIMNRISPTGRVWDTEEDHERAKHEMRMWFIGEAAKDK